MNKLDRGVQEGFNINNAIDFILEQVTELGKEVYIVEEVFGILIGRTFRLLLLAVFWVGLASFKGAVFLEHRILKGLLEERVTQGRANESQAKEDLLELFTHFPEFGVLGNIREKSG